MTQFIHEYRKCFVKFAIKKQQINGQSIVCLAESFCNCNYQICNLHPLVYISPNMGPMKLLAIIKLYSYQVCIY